MLEVTATEFAKNFGRYRELAQRDPIAVTSHQRTSGYFVSEYDFKEYQSLKAQASQAFYWHELPAETRDALQVARMSPEHDHLNKLLDGA